MTHANDIGRLGSLIRLQVLETYTVSPQFGHDCARRYLFEVAEAIAINETRELAASSVYGVADAIAAQCPLPPSVFQAAAKAAPDQAMVRGAVRKIAICATVVFLIGMSFGFALARFVS